MFQITEKLFTVRRLQPRRKGSALRRPLIRRPDEPTSGLPGYRPEQLFRC